MLIKYHVVVCKWAGTPGDISKFLFYNKTLLSPKPNMKCLPMGFGFV